MSWIVCALLVVFVVINLIPSWWPPPWVNAVLFSAIIAGVALWPTFTWWRRRRRVREVQELVQRLRGASSPEQTVAATVVWRCRMCGFAITPQSHLAVSLRFCGRGRRRGACTDDGASSCCAAVNPYQHLHAICPRCRWHEHRDIAGEAATCARCGQEIPSGRP